MMLRVFAALCLTVVAVVILYVPSAHPPERFLDQMRVEHELAVRFCGAQCATRILSRMLDLHAGAPATSPLAGAFAHPLPVNRVDAAIASQLSQVTDRLFNNRYFKSIEALFVLVTYRFSGLLDWLPLSAVFIVAAGCDGAMRRIVKSKLFLQHSAESFAVCICLTIVAVCSLVVALVVPLTVDPWLLAATPILAALFGSQAIAHFHRRG